MYNYKIVKESSRDGKVYFYPKFRYNLIFWNYFYNSGEHKIGFLTEGESEKFINDYLNDKKTKKELVKYIK